MQQQKDPDSEPTIGEDIADTGPEPTESGFNDTPSGDRSSPGGEVNEHDPSWRPGDEPTEAESAPASSRSLPQGQ